MKDYLAFLGRDGWIKKDDDSYKKPMSTMELPDSVPLNWEHIESEILGYVDSFQYDDNGGLQGIAHVNDDVVLRSRNGVSLEYYFNERLADGTMLGAVLCGVAVTEFPADPMACLIPYPDWK